MCVTWTRVDDPFWVGRLGEPFRTLQGDLVSITAQAVLGCHSRRALVISLLPGRECWVTTALALRYVRGVRAVASWPIRAPDDGLYVVVDVRKISRDDCVRSTPADASGRDGDVGVELFGGAVLVEVCCAGRATVP
jgi:hypothetical protein